MKAFIKVINWSYFLKIISGISLFLIYSKIFRPKDLEPLSWFFVISMILFISIVLLSYAYLQYYARKKTVVLTLKEQRKKKLKRINRIW